MFLRLLIACFLSLLLMITSQTYAQETEQKDTLQDKRSEAISQLKLSNLVRTHAQRLGRIEGHFVKSTKDSLFLHTDIRQGSVPVVSINALWVRGRATKTGAIVGGIIGAAGGVLFFGFLVSFEAGSGDYNRIGGAILGGLAGGAVCGLLGAGIGTAFPKWHLRYRSPTYSGKSKAEK